jgi:Ni/Fe-hydrogenase subunit HybB-like protein
MSLSTEIAPAPGAGKIVAEAQWERSAPVSGVPTLTWLTWPMVIASIIAVVMTGARSVMGLAAFSGMTDSYAWGIWKTFNVMTLTALGSGGLAVGVFANVFGQKKLHPVMRVALVTSLLFYTTGMIALLADLGRPWNFYHILFPNHWNLHSALFEVAICMPTYLVVFLFMENLPPIFERLKHHKDPKLAALFTKWLGVLVKWMPLVAGGAYLLPMMHQSSLGALMLLAGQKVHPLWQTQMLPLLYLVAAFVCGFSMVIVTLVLTSIMYARPVDRGQLALLGKDLAWVSVVFTVLRLGDLAAHGNLGYAFDLSAITLLFWLETIFTIVPALLLFVPSIALRPRVNYHLALLIGTASLLYRFSPTTVVYHPNGYAVYFPSVNELLMSGGFICMGVVAFSWLVKKFAILPDTLAHARRVEQALNNG